MVIRFNPFIFLFFSLLGLTGRVQSADIAPEYAPNWMMPTLSGQQVSLYEELEKGNSVVMVFWASWCKFCRELLPEINLLSKEQSLKGVHFYALNIWEDGNPEAYLQERNISLETVLNADSQAKQFNIKSTPGVIVVAPNKEIIYRRKSGDSTADVVKAIRSLSLPAIRANKKQPVSYTTITI